MLSLLLQACIENPRNQLPVLLVECQLLSNDQTLENMALLIQVKKMIFYYLQFVFEFCTRESSFERLGRIQNGNSTTRTECGKLGEDFH